MEADREEEEANKTHPEPHLVATTKDINEQPSISNLSIERLSAFPEPSHFFKSIQWSPDGTTILASLSTNTLCSYIAPPDLLSPPSNGPHALTPYSTHQIPEPAYATAIHPSHDLQSPSTCLALASVRNLPLRLFSTLCNPANSPEDGNGGVAAASAVVASYPLVSPTTEAYLGVHALTFGAENWVYAGAEGMVAAFDLSRSGEGPVSVMRTGKGRGRRRRGGAAGGGMVGMESLMGMKGIVSALSVSSERMMAAGTFGRDVGLYDGFGDGGTVATFSLQGEVDGGGVTDVRWSACGRYLCVVERGSDGVSVWDIRGLGKRLAWLAGRKAETQQRMGVEVFDGQVWAGGTDGVVRVWEGIGTSEGDVKPTWDFCAHEDAVSGVGIHSCGNVLASSSGQRHFGVGEKVGEVAHGADVEEVHESHLEKPDTLDSTLKIWAF